MSSPAIGRAGSRGNTGSCTELRAVGAWSSRVATTTDAETRASLSFLGFGLPTTVPSWGGVLSREAAAYVTEP